MTRALIETKHTVVDFRSNFAAPWYDFTIIIKYHRGEELELWPIK